MSANISCPVFRCPKDSIAQCTGYRRACDRFYCAKHTRGTLCERCASIKQEGMKAQYKSMLKTLERKSFSAALTPVVIALLSISILLVIFAIALWYFKSAGENIKLFVLSLGGGVLGLVGALILYLIKTREYMRTESVELDLTYPGFYDYYLEWQSKMDAITTNTWQP